MLTPSDSAARGGRGVGYAFDRTVTRRVIRAVPAEMRVLFLKILESTVDRFSVLRKIKNNGGEDSATGQCGASFQQTRTNLCSTSGDAQAGNGTAPFALFGCVSLIFQPIPKPTVNDLPLLVANRTKFEKVGPFIL